MARPRGTAECPRHSEASRRLPGVERHRHQPLHRKKHARPGDHHPNRQLHVFDLRNDIRELWPDIRGKMVEGSSGILLRHIDHLGREGAEELLEALRAAAASSRPPWIGATRGTATAPSPNLSEMLAYFTRAVDIPPLRHHIEDIEDIAPLMLRQATKRPEVTFISSTLHILMRRSWPENIRELRDLIMSITTSNNGDTVSPDDLPPQCFSQHKRVLTRLESIERDAIVKSLTETRGNRSKAARAIGISRATIYRKINDYGIDIPSNS